MGSALFMSAILTAIVLPKHEDGTDREAGRKYFMIYISSWSHTNHLKLTLIKNDC